MTSSELRKIALRLPGTEEGVACEGTALEKRTIRTGGKAFLFLGANDATLKLRDSLDEVVRLAANEPSRYRAGSSGWVTVKLDGEAPAARLRSWIAESHALFAKKPASKAARVRRK